MNINDFKSAITLKQFELTPNKNGVFIFLNDSECTFCREQKEILHKYKHKKELSLVVLGSHNYNWIKENIVPQIQIFVESELIFKQSGSATDHDLDKCVFYYKRKEVNYDDFLDTVDD